MSVQQFAVFGHPIRHSLSPRIHQAFAAQFDIALDYQTIDATTEEFPAAVQRFFADGGRGANVTLPHKAAAFALATEHTPAARRAGTANVLTPLPDGRLAAHNTDGIGMLRDMTVRQGIDLRDRHVLLLGAGGAARGVAWNLLDAGIATLVIANRSPDAANALTAALDDPARVGTCRWEALADAGPPDLIVNATSAGVLGGSLQLPPTLLRDGASCYDLSYGAAANSFLAWARNAGARRTADGLGMLLETAADAFELWHGRLPDTGPVYRMLRPSS